MCTFLDGEGVVHAVIYDHLKGTHVNTYQSACREYDDIHRGDIYFIKYRPITCMLCAAVPVDDLD